MATKQEKMDRGDLVDDDELENEEDLEENEEDLDESESDEEDDSEDEEEDSEDGEESDEEDLDDDDEDSDRSSEDEESEEGDESGEESDEGEDDEEDNQRIPRSRLNQVIKQRDEEKNRTRWLEDQLEKLIDKQDVKEKEVKETPEYDFNQSETQYIELILEGETQKAIALRNEIENARIEVLEQKFGSDTKEAKRVAKEEAQASIEEDRFDSMIENYENKFTFLDVDSADYNEEAIETVNTLMAGYQAGGETKSQSLKKAVTKVAPMYEPVKKKTTIKKKGLGDRTKTARKRNAKASQQQPVKNKGKRSESRDLDELDVSKLSDDEFKKLSTREKKILRGDM